MGRLLEAWPLGWECVDQGLEVVHVGEDEQGGKKDMFGAQRPAEAGQGGYREPKSDVSMRYAICVAGIGLRTQPSSYSWSMRTSWPARRGNSSSIEGLKSS